MSTEMANERLIEIVLERFIVEQLLLGSGRTALDPNEHLISSGVLDSLALLQLIAFIEQQFGVAIHDGEVIPDNFQTIKLIGAFIARKRTS